MIISFRERVTKYIYWWVKRTRQSSRLINGLVIVFLCFGMFVIASFYDESTDQYDVEPYEYYPIVLECDVVQILDGDTITVQCPKSLGSTEKSLRSIRFWGIDAPETDQGVWGDLATETLRELIRDQKSVTIEIMNQDRYQRMIGKIFVNDQDIALEMVRLGVAVVYHRYNQDQGYINVEKKAKIDRLGIWKVSGAQQDPERWRRFNP